jgi:hypothetical protein
MTSTRMTSPSAPLAGPDAAAEVDGRLAAVFERSGFLAVLAPRRLLAPARRVLLERLPLVEVEVTAILLERLRTPAIRGRTCWRPTPGIRPTRISGRWWTWSATK